MKIQVCSNHGPHRQGGQQSEDGVLKFYTGRYREKSSGKALSKRKAETCVKAQVMRIEIRSWLKFDHDSMEKSGTTKELFLKGVKKSLEQQKGFGNMWIKIGRFVNFWCDI